MPDRSYDWWAQAQRDLELARHAARSGFHEWAYFAAHQAAEKAVKALHLRLGQQVWGHAVARLLTQLPDVVWAPTALLERARVLDAYYIPPRYPDSYPEGAPFEHYGGPQSEEAVAYAGQMVEFVRAQMA